MIEDNMTTISLTTATNAQDCEHNAEIERLQAKCDGIITQHLEIVKGRDAEIERLKQCVTNILARVKNMAECAFTNMEGAEPEAFEAYESFYVACSELLKMAELEAEVDEMLK